MTEIHAGPPRGRRLPAQRPLPRQHPLGRPRDPRARLRRGRARLHRRAPRPIRPTAATRCRRRTCRAPATSTRRGRSTSPACGPARLRGRRGHHPHVPRGASACPSSGTATTSRPSGRRGSASDASRSSAPSTGVETVEAFVREWFDYSERRMADALKELPSGTLVGRYDPRSLPGPAGRDPAEGHGADRRRGGTCRDRPARQPGQLRRRAQRVARLRDEQRRSSGSSTRSTRTSRTTRAASGASRVHLREGCIAGIPRFPHSCSMATTNVADRLVCMTQAAFADSARDSAWRRARSGSASRSPSSRDGDDRSTARRTSTRSSSAAPAGPARRTADGWPTYILPVCAALMYHDSIEVDEQKYPFHVYEQRLIPDSEGAGRHRGGLGIERRLRPEEPAR